MAIKKTKGTRRLFRKAEQLLVTPYTKDGDGNLILSEDTFDIADIVADTISIELEDGDEDKVESEFGDTLINNSTSGSWTFNADCLDFQNAIISAIYGFITGKASSQDLEGAAIMPEESEPIYAFVHIRFGRGNTDVVIPKLLLNSKASLDTLRTGTAKGKITGSSEVVEIVVFENNKSASDTSKTAVKFNDHYVNRTSIAYVPNGYVVAVSEDSVNYYPGAIDNNTWSKVSVNKDTGAVNKQS